LAHSADACVRIVARGLPAPEVRGGRVSASDPKTTFVGLLRWPGSESLSPPMQNAGFAALGLNWTYVTLPTPPGRLADAVENMVAGDFAGANVTIPHKAAVIALCDEVDPTAAEAGTVNTLVIRDGRISGSTTDVTAIAAAVDATGRRALVLGSGGSAKAAVAALRSAGADVSIATRHDHDWPPTGLGFDIVVNATPVKDTAIVTPRPGQQIVDLPYNTDGTPTALVGAARAAGCDRVVDGLDILLAQGTASFELWTGLPAPIEAMRAALRSAI
jgi:shikimate dehydrogenase